MQIVNTYGGNVNVTRTLITMEPGESWRLDSACFKETVIRSTCSRLGTMRGLSFSVAVEDGALQITRNF